MYTFIIGVIILIFGGIGYAFVAQKIFGASTNNKTIAFTKRDNVDYVPMSKFRNACVQLKSIAGTGPILGPIQAILFGPIVFLTIPIGCIVGGVIHDTYSGLISMRNGGAQMPELIKRYLGKTCQIIFLLLLLLVGLLVSALFLSMPGTIIAGSIAHVKPISLHGNNTFVNSWILWLVLFFMFSYYVLAVLFPIDKVIGKVYPYLSILLIGGTIALFIGTCVGHDKISTIEIWTKGSMHGFIPVNTGHFIPLFFVTVTCGMVSGFHSTQSTIIGRAVKNEKHSVMVFSLPMIIEGCLAMIWGLAAMSLFQNKPGLVPSNPSLLNPSSTLGPLTQDNLGEVFGDFILIVVAMEAVTTGDTALRSCRLVIADFLKIDQRTMKKRLIISIPLFVICIGLLMWTLLDNAGFSKIWQYFAWGDQLTVAFTFAASTVYLMRNKKFFYHTLIPGGWYSFIAVSSIVGSSKIGLGQFFNDIPPFGALWICAYIFGIIAGIIFVGGIYFWGRHSSKNINIHKEDKQLLI